MSDRLRLAVENGHVALPDGNVLVLNVESAGELAVFDPDRTWVWSRTGSAHREIEADGWKTDLPAESFQGSVVKLPRSRDAQRAWLKKARKLTDGPIIVDGDKKNGVDALYREVRKRADVSEAWSKAHGKVFTVSGGDFRDWPSPDPVLAEDGWWRAPGVFSADGVDKASAFLAEALPDTLKGAVVDLGAGWGFLSRAILERDGVTALHLVEDDFLSLRAAGKNVTDPRANFHAADARSFTLDQPADHVVTNPPFHTGRAADPALGQAFIRAAATMLKPKGNLWLVANRHLPYESTLEGAFRTVRLVAETPSFKIFNASQPRSPRKG